MPSATYNASGVNGRPAVDLASESGLLTVAITTRTGAQSSRAATHIFPGLSGAGRIHFGLNPRQIQWQIVMALDPDAAPDPMTALRAIEAKLESYIEFGGRFRLISEWGETWDDVELTDYQRSEVEPTTDGERIIVTAAATFEWMQP